MKWKSMEHLKKKQSALDIKIPPDRKVLNEADVEEEAVGFQVANTSAPCPLKSEGVSMAANRHKHYLTWKLYK